MANSTALCQSLSQITITTNPTTPTPVTTIPTAPTPVTYCYFSLMAGLNNMHHGVLVLMTQKVVLLATRDVVTTRRILRVN